MQEEAGINNQQNRAPAKPQAAASVLSLVMRLVTV